ncbi:hypothetical protein [Nitratireductor sp. ZSWI3]|uniref:hypothetical protein n=1 Tax=Nitratireductor sp. ZSWI3 TaxID=2966359 RepID=UPI0021501723|nr:hypothetical protein [Nitratireductor sp. ZSWI3]MCR4264826.1 hypothetical protein [Nitratireductor sp. ZSWI3]
MTSSFLRIAAAMPLLALAGCNSAPPPDYSPGYSYVAANGFADSSKTVGGSVLVPEACLAEPADQAPNPAATRATIVPELGPHLPPGCANAYNLQRMVESERDLVEGRRSGPASAAPTARAARKYLYGEELPLGGARNTGMEPSPVQ